MVEIHDEDQPVLKKVSAPDSIVEKTPLKT